jgi:hypothetical protein
MRFRPVPLFCLAFGLLALFTATSRSGAQAQSTAVTVLLLEPIDSANGAAGQRYRAAIVSDTTIAGIPLIKGASATVTLVPGTGGFRWNLNLIEISVRGKMAGVLGQSPTIVPATAGVSKTMQNAAVIGRDRIYVAAGQSIRFVLGPANGSSTPPSGAASAKPPALAAQAPAAGAGARPDRSAQYRAMPVAGPKSAPDALIGPAGAVLSSPRVKYEVRLDHCDRKATASTSCDFTYLNFGEEKEIRVGTGAFVAVDSKGQTIGMKKQLLAGGTTRSVAVPGLPGHVHFDYDGLDPDVTSLARVNLKIYEPPWNSWAEFEFRNVPLNAPPAQLAAFTSVPRPAANTTEEHEGWRISVVRCSTTTRSIDPDTQVIECFFKVENEKADRTLNLGEALFVDEDGREHFSTWFPSGSKMGANATSGLGYIGTEARYSRTALVPTKNTPVNGVQLVTEVDGTIYPTIKNGEPRYAYAIFSGIPKEIKRIPHLRYTFNFSPPGNANHFIDFYFNEIAITPMPQTAAKAK